MTTNTSLFSTDPTLLLSVTEVNGYPVLANRSDGNRTFVLCDRVADAPEYGPWERFVTWSIWRTEAGKIAAEGGGYFIRLHDAVIDLFQRSGTLDILKAKIKEAEKR